jgi:hypothetical protein
MLFEAVEELKDKVDRLEKAKNSVGDLERYGLGKDVVYITYIHDGAPEKIVFKAKEGRNRRKVQVPGRLLGSCTNVKRM